MEMQEWKDGIVDKAVRQITLQSNMSTTDISKLTLVLIDYLDDGIRIIEDWRKLKTDDEFSSGKHDTALVGYLKNRYLDAGRELFSDYSSGGVRASRKQTPESVLKSSCKQVM
jgi:hypothetical protein